MTKQKLRHKEMTCKIDILFYVCCVDPCKVHEISYREQVDTCWCCSIGVSPAWTHPKNGPDYTFPPKNKLGIEFPQRKITTPFSCPK